MCYNMKSNVIFCCCILYNLIGVFMRNIVVIGAGHGGLVAAYKLASNGYNVTVIEKAEETNISYDWEDDIRFDIFEVTGIPLPPKEIYSQKLKWRFISPDEKNTLNVPQAPPMEEISIYRRGLANHLISVCKDAGVKFIFNETAELLNFSSDFVTSVTSSSGKTFPSDLVIDASGIHSPFRAQLPDKFLVQKSPKEDDLMSACRVFYKSAEGVAKPIPDNNMYLLHLDFPGIAWCNHNHLGEVDILIGRFGPLTNGEAENAIDNLRYSNPILSYELVKEPIFTKIAVRYPLAVPVADGYVAIGDSAFQTMPLMGSGIEASMKAGSFLVEQLISLKDKPFSAFNMWPYQVKFMEEIGASYMFIDVLKRWALSLPIKQVNWLFSSGAITDKDLALISTDKDPDAKPGSTSIARKALILLKNPRLIGLAAGCLIKASHAKSIAGKIPETYDIDKIAKWQEKYDGCIEHK